MILRDEYCSFCNAREKRCHHEIVLGIDWSKSIGILLSEIRVSYKRNTRFSVESPGTEARSAKYWMGEQ